MKKFSSLKYKLLSGMVVILFLSICVCVISYSQINKKKELLNKDKLLLAYNTLSLNRYKERFDVLEKRLRKILWSAKIAENVEKRQIVALKDYLDGIFFSLEKQEYLTNLVVLDDDFSPLYYIEANKQAHFDKNTLLAHPTIIKFLNTLKAESCPGYGNFNIDGKLLFIVGEVLLNEDDKIEGYALAFSHPRTDLDKFSLFFKNTVAAKQIGADDKFYYSTDKALTDQIAKDVLKKSLSVNYVLFNVKNKTYSAYIMKMTDIAEERIFDMWFIDDVSAGAKMLDKLQFINFIVLLFTLILGVLFMNASMGKLLRPLFKMQAVLKDISEGDLSKNIEVTTGDELAATAGSINAMAGKLKGIVAEVKGVSGKINSLSLNLTNIVSQEETVSNAVSSTMHRLSDVFFGRFGKASRF